MTTYNYSSFPLDGDIEDFVHFPAGLRVGTKAPDHELIDASSGNVARLSDYYEGGAAVIEFGSYT